MTLERKNWRWMAEFIVHSWFVSIRTGLEWANALSMAVPAFSLRLKYPVNCRTGNLLIIEGYISNEEALPSPIIFCSITKSYCILKLLTEKTT